MDQISTQPVPAPSPVPDSLPGVDTLLKQAWQVYKQRFWTLLGIVAIPGAVAIIGSLFLGGSALLGRYAHIDPVASGGSLLALFLVYIVAVFILGVWCEAALITNLADDSQNMGIKQAFVAAKGKIASLFLVNLLAGLAVVGGFILLIIPGIIFMVWLSQSSYVAVVENLKGTGALKQSKSYVKGRFGAVLWRLAFVLLVSILLSIVVGIIGDPFNPSGSEVVSQNLQNIASFLLSPLAAAYGFSLYKALRKA